MESNRDSWVDAADPNANHSRDPELVAKFQAGAGSRILLGFDMRRLEGATINSATLSLQLTMGEGEPAVNMAISSLSEKWDGSELNWNNQPERSKTYGQQPIGLEPEVITFDATSLLQDTIGSDLPHYGYALSGPVAGSPPNYLRRFASREGRDGGPKLSVDYVGGAAADSSEAVPHDRNGPADIRLLALPLVALLLLAAAIFIRRRKSSPADQAL